MLSSHYLPNVIILNELRSAYNKIKKVSFWQILQY
jgi:hypothetical protein